MIEYRDIPGFPGYQAGSDGSIWSYRQHKPRKMHPVASKTGHLGLYLLKRKTYVHRLVALAFIGDIPPKMDVCHNDNNPANNAPSNLRIDTRWGNLNDRYKHGTMNWGSRQGHSKLTEEQIPKIFEMRAMGAQCKEILDMYHITHGTLTPLLKRRTWRHVAIDPALVERVSSMKKIMHPRVPN